MDYKTEQTEKMQGRSAKWPDDGLEDVSCCPICGSSERSLLYRGLADRIFFCAPGEWTMYKCHGCGSGYLDPRPTADTIHIAYHGYFTHDSPAQKDREKLGPVQRLERFLVSSYWQYYYGRNHRLSTVMGAMLMRPIPQFRHILDRHARYLPTVSAGGRLLDVGFGGGQFLHFARNRGWCVAGVDTDPIVVANARDRGLEVREGGIEAFADQPESFDVITMCHVIEHVHDPKSALRQSFRLLKPNGKLYLETPNIESVGHKEFGENWRALEPPRHLTIFSWAALENFLAQLGFDILRHPCAPDIYPKVEAKSLSLKHGKDPEKEEKRENTANPGIVFVKTKRINNYRDCEFIMLTARKPY